MRAQHGLQSDESSLFSDTWKFEVLAVLFYEKVRGVVADALYGLWRSLSKLLQETRRNTLAVRLTSSDADRIALDRVRCHLQPHYLVAPTYTQRVRSTARSACLAKMPVIRQHDRSLPIRILWFGHENLI